LYGSLAGRDVTAFVYNASRESGANAFWPFLAPDTHKKDQQAPGFVCQGIPVLRRQDLGGGPSASRFATFIRPSRQKA
jgi:hypothetical protein